MKRKANIYREGSIIGLSLFILLFILNIAYSQDIIEKFYKQYPAKFFYTSVGISDVSYDDALKKALSNISKQIQSKVESKSYYIKSDMRGVISDVYLDFSKISSNLYLKGYKIVDKKKIQGNYYVFVVIDKYELLNRLKKEYLMYKNLIEKYYNSGLEFLNNGKLEMGVFNLLGVKKFLPNYYQVLTLLSAISSPPSEKVYTWNKIVNIIFDYVKGIKFIFPKDTIYAKLGKSVDFKVKIITKNNIPVKNLKVVVLRSESFQPIGEYISNDKGEIKVNFKAYYSPEIDILTFYPITSFDLPDIKSLFKNLEFKVYYITKVSKFPDFSIEFKELDIENKVYRQEVKQTIQQQINNYGLNITEKSPYKLEVYLLRGNREYKNGFYREEFLLTIELHKDNKKVYTFSKRIYAIGRDYSSLFKSLKSKLYLPESLFYDIINNI